MSDDSAVFAIEFRGSMLLCCLIIDLGGAGTPGEDTPGEDTPFAELAGPLEGKILIDDNREDGLREVWCILSLGDLVNLSQAVGAVGHRVEGAHALHFGDDGHVNTLGHMGDLIPERMPAAIGNIPGGLGGRGQGRQKPQTGENGFHHSPGVEA